MLIELIIQGLVQGVGFRPFIYTLAKRIGIRGTVANGINGIIIHAELTSDQLERFIGCIRSEHPVVATIRDIRVSELQAHDEEYTDFSIIASHSGSDEITQVAPDIAVCDRCMDDRTVQRHRMQYPFINCTHCGPRFSITKDLPYDRIRTTMSGFGMCPACSKEYADESDRRFHAQPVACNHCGPYYYATFEHKEYRNYQHILALSASLIHAGKIIAAKGTGGYHLICDATNEASIKRLRGIKIRDTKPFAVMFNSLQDIEEYAFVNEKEKEELNSWRRPIVLLEQKKTLASGINNGMHTLGCMLPYMPVHYDWFRLIDCPALVMTSGNPNDRPIIITPEEADERLRYQVDLVIHHNRPIHNRTDDSVVQIYGSHTSLIRRSRGYAPQPFLTDTSVDGLLAFGAEKANTFAIGKGTSIIQSQHIGDLKNAETFDFYTEALERFRRLFRFTPRLLICDLHPDYLSSGHAAKIAGERRLPLLTVQHHHAHATACMLEHCLNEPVIAVIWDGAGLGDDGEVWGGEFFLCDRKDYVRLAHLAYVPMPGGDKVSLEPWRMAVSYYHHYGIPLPPAFAERIGKEKTDQVMTLIDKKINTPYTSSAGRLFDAFASMLGICDVSSRQSEAAVLLEQCADKTCESYYPVCTDGRSISLKSMIQETMADVQRGVGTDTIAATFHNSLVHLIVQKSKQLSEQTGITNVVISGGCFQNKWLTEKLQERFRTEKMALYIPGQIPCNDGGISAGQIAIAAARDTITF